LHAGKARVVSVNEDIPTVGWSREVYIPSIGIDGLYIPNLTSGHDKVIREIGV
jgi:hypothetical protein